MFQTMMTEAIQNQVDLSTFPAPVVQGMLEYAYTGNIKIDLSLTGDYLRIADMYELKGLKASVEAKASSKLNVENAIETFELSNLYSAVDLKAKVVHFLKR